MDRLHASPAAAVEHPAHPVSDQQTEAEVVEQAKRLVAVAGLQQATAGYLLLSCKDRDSPPYQGVVYLNFALPAAHPDTSFAGIFEHIAATLAAHGWQQGRPPNHMFGKTLSKDGVTAVIYRDDDQPGVGVVRLYGQCRDTTDHRTDTTGWADVTAQIR
ncbi:MAG: hypothetical protein F6Q13_13440 [Mycobacterium sp.]|nr:MAG: hypothetical protein F6Q13_13440 [Mycobacterium sp.]